MRPLECTTEEGASSQLWTLRLTTPLKCPQRLTSKAVPFHMQFRNMYLRLTYGEPSS